MENETTAARTVKVIGHRNPDTDSICSAIAYSRLKTAVDGEHSYEPCREHFEAQPPQLYTDVSPQIRDVDVRRVEGVDGEMSLRRAWTTMRDEQIDTLCVLDGEGRLQGLVTTKDVAVANMDLLDDTILAKAGTSYQNVIDTLGATVLAGDVKGKKVAGRIVIGAGNAELMEKAISKGDLVIVSNRSDSQLTAIEMDAGCIVVCADSKVSSTIQALAEERGCLIIATPHPTYICGQMITQAAPVDQIPGFSQAMCIAHHIPGIQQTFFFNDRVNDIHKIFIQLDVIPHPDRQSAKAAILSVYCRNHGAELPCFDLF